MNDKAEWTLEFWDPDTSSWGASVHNAAATMYWIKNGVINLSFTLEEGMKKASQLEKQTKVLYRVRNMRTGSFIPSTIL